MHKGHTVLSQSIPGDSIHSSVSDHTLFPLVGGERTITPTHHKKKGPLPTSNNGPPFPMKKGEAALSGPAYCYRGEFTCPLCLVPLCVLVIHAAAVLAGS